MSLHYCQGGEKGNIIYITKCEKWYKNFFLLAKGAENVFQNKHLKDFENVSKRKVCLFRINK